MTQAEIRRTIKYVLAESSRWLLQTKGHEKKKHTGMQEKKKKKEERIVGSKAQEQARKSYSGRLHTWYLLIARVPVHVTWYNIIRGTWYLYLVLLQQ